VVPTHVINHPELLHVLVWAEDKSTVRTIVEQLNLTPTLLAGHTDWSLLHITMDYRLAALTLVRILTDN